MIASGAEEFNDRRPAVWLDHFVVAIDDLDSGVSTFEELTGIRPVYGGEHPMLGTHNALVSLGPTRYLEILAPRPGASLAPKVRKVAEHADLTPILWALATEDAVELHGVVAASGFAADEPTPGTRLKEDGEIISWSMFMLKEGRPVNAPFFIQWDPASRHPSTASPDGCSLESFTVASTEHEELGRLLGAVGFTASVVPGPQGIAISLRTPRGPVTLGGRAAP